ncbi:hypothetical protein ABQF35_14475 [Mycobacterium syngnathidarum]
MTRTLWIAAWVFGVIAAAAYIALWRELFFTAAILAALSTLAWGFRVHPDSDAWRAPVYQHEADEWRRAVNDMSEMERASVNYHSVPGVFGDREDALDEIGGRR